jgi:hypothetical protein
VVADVVMEHMPPIARIVWGSEVAVLVWAVRELIAINRRYAWRQPLPKARARRST